MFFSKKIKRAVISLVALISLVSCGATFSAPVKADVASYQTDQVK